VVHSATKYLGGHGDVMAGIVACSAARARDLALRQRLLGANLAPDEAWLALRGLKTLPLRLWQQCANADHVAAFLAGHPAVSHVNYPGLADHPQHDLCSRLYGGRGYGAMMSFDLRGAGQRQVFRFMEALRLVTPATTLGDIYSLVLYPAGSSTAPWRPRCAPPWASARVWCASARASRTPPISSPISIRLWPPSLPERRAAQLSAPPLRPTIALMGTTPMPPVQKGP
jgi:cystathionine beta-lyase/cystathionine gamma-synthase